MNTAFIASLIFLLLGLTWFAWRYYGIRNSLHSFTQNLNRGELPNPSDDSRESEEFFRAVESYASSLRTQLGAANTDRGRLAAVLDQLTDGVLIVNSEGRIQFANPAAQVMFGGELIERSVPETLRHHQLIQAWQRGHTNGEVQSASVEIPALRQFLQLIVIPDQYTSGGSLLLVQDLTRVRRLETVRRDFISNLSHELRTPLASLKALTETLTGGALEDPPAARKFIDQIEIEVDALTQMVNELLELSQIESGRLNLEVKAVDICNLLKGAAERMHVQAERAGLHLRVECEGNIPDVKIDETRLEQVLVNLIHNAVKFTKPGGEVVLSASAVSNGVQVAVRDTGVGIDPDDLTRIFERFYKSDRSRAGGGTGLGLSIARHIVEAHGGKIWASSEPGFGSTFYFSIPAVINSEYHLPRLN